MINVVIDISHYQDPDWAVLKAGNVLGVIHKASEGSDHQDSAYLEHRAGALAAGLLWGAYHLGNSSDTEDQVKNFLKCALPDADTLLCLQWQDLGGGGDTSGSGGELDEGKQEPVATSSSSGELDEGKQDPVSGGGGGNTMSVDQVREFVTLVNKQQGQFPVLCSGTVAKNVLGDEIDAVLAQCPYWLVQYSDTPSDVPRTWADQRWSLWQYTDGVSGPEPHEAPGIGPCFRDRFNGEEADLRSFWKGGEAAAKPPTGKPEAPGRPESPGRSDAAHDKDKKERGR